MANQSARIASQQIITDVLFDSIGEGAITTDEYGKITRINPVAERILGYSAKDVIGKWFPELFTAYDDNGLQIAQTDRPLTRAFVSGQIISDQVLYRHKNGTMVRVDLTISPIMVNDVPTGCIQIFRDIGEEYEIDKMKSDFISLASHQLRTPLSSVKTYSHMLIEGMHGPLTKPQLKAVKTILSAANRMNETVSTLLNISRIESGNIIAERKSLSIPKIFESVVDDHHLAALDKKINFKVINPSKNTKLVSDEVVLKEVLGNLISNAIKYTPTNGTITLSAVNQNKRVIISVNDTGVGIPLESHHNVFSKFFRADNVVRQDTSGIGLGLYLVKGLMDELGGKVWFESNEGEGTTFYLSFPLGDATKVTDVKKATAK